MDWIKGYSNKKGHLIYKEGRSSVKQYQWSYQISGKN